MAKNKDKMQMAKNRRQDEFYTLYHVVSDEMIYYIEHFKNKVIYCNTDDINSNFWKYFDDNFEKTRIKKIIATKHNKDGNGEKYELEIINGKKYIKYDNCNAIEVSKTKEIPVNYEGMMGVPITFLDKYNPKQFEIIRFRKGDDGKDVSINGKCPYFRILIQKRKDD